MLSEGKITITPSKSYLYKDDFKKECKKYKETLKENYVVDDDGKSVLKSFSTTKECVESNYIADGWYFYVGGVVVIILSAFLFVKSIKKLFKNI